MSTKGGPILMNDDLVFAYDTSSPKTYTNGSSTLYDFVGDVDAVHNGTAEPNGVFYDGTDGLDVAWPSSLNSDDNTTPRSWECIAIPTSSSMNSGNHTIFGHKANSSCYLTCNGGFIIRSNVYQFCWYDNAAYQYATSSVSPVVGQSVHLVGTFDIDRKPRMYVNGELYETYTTATNINYLTGMERMVIGTNWNTSWAFEFEGYIPVTRYYKGTALSLEQVQQNYNEFKPRFNL